MGVDIRAFIEYRSPRRGDYWLFCRPRLPRIYGIFAAMADWRDVEPDNQIRPVVDPPRGIPDGLDLITAMKIEKLAKQIGGPNGGLSGAGWLTPDEFERALQVAATACERDIDDWPEYLAALAALRALPESRIIFVWA